MRSQDLLLSEESLESSPTVAIATSTAFDLPLTMSATSGLPTRSNILEHLLVSVLNAGDPQAPYRRAFQTAGATSVEDVLELTKDDLKSLSWRNLSGEICHLPIGAVNTILSIGGWFANQGTTDVSGK